ncbi:MAG: hypothetical protein HPY83_10960 [Anaerolineae bacterium]|nr:hypothetical protein [Anaerolineae bacterium]
MADADRHIREGTSDGIKQLLLRWDDRALGLPFVRPTLGDLLQKTTLFQVHLRKALRLRRDGWGASGYDRDVRAGAISRC